MAIIGAILLAIGGWSLYRSLAGGAGEEQGSGGRPPVAVAAGEAKTSRWKSRLTAVGSIEAIQSVDVTVPIAGIVESIAFDAGQRVEKGKLLISLDTTTERAALRSLDARLDKAEADADRANELGASGAIPEADVESARTAAESLRAQLDQQRTLIEKKRVNAPFTGELGIREISLGEFVSPGAAVVSLQSIAPIYVEFSLPEAEFARVKVGQAVSVAVNAYSDEPFAGEVVTVDARIASGTRAFAVQAEIPNEDRRLVPGMFADVELDLGETRDVVTVPDTAIAYNAYGSTVFLLREGDGRGDRSGASDEGAPPTTVERAFVETGERRGGRVEVLEGLSAGDRVVTAGQLKLDDGAPVKVSDESPDRAPDGESPDSGS